MEKLENPPSERPPLDDAIKPSDLRDYYWMKAELAAWCRGRGIPSGGGKWEIIERMVRFLETGDRGLPVGRKPRGGPRFDRAGEALTPDTVITLDYRATRNVRTFFERHLGEGFRITVPFTEWMRAHTGRTLADAIDAWRVLKDEVRNADGPKRIAPQFEFNRYVQAFMADNPGRARREAVACWMEKKKRKGPRVYHRDDLGFLPQD
jgi:hypothetical protein